jgi:hypothetical protein
MTSNQVNTRPLRVRIYTLLLIVSAAIMAALGWSASAYYVPAVCLLLQAVLLWKAWAYGLFKWIALINQISGLILILVLWLGDGLAMKLDISASMLLINLLCGGPLMAILAAFILPSLHKGKRLFQWFHPHIA